jgi:hypothetical protein
MDDHTEVKLSQSGAWAHSAYPLHILAVDGDPAQIEALLQAGEDVNKEDFLSTRPLHVAALFNNIEAANLFIQYGADVNDDSYYGVTALHLAVASENYDMANLLITAQADYNAGYEYGVTPALILLDHFEAYANLYEQSAEASIVQKAQEVGAILKSLGHDAVFSLSNDFDEKVDYPSTYLYENYFSQLPNNVFKEMIQDLIPETPSDFMSAFLKAKLFLHIFPTGQTYPLEIDNNIYYLESEGFWGTYTAQYIFEASDAYVTYLSQCDEYDPLAFSLFSKVTESFHLATDLAWHSGESTAYENALEAYQQGQSVLLPSGWEGHYVNIIVSEPQAIFASANSGQRYDEHEAGVTFYKMVDPDLIDTDFIGHVLMNEDEMILEYALLYEYGLLENIEFMPGDNQDYGNCGMQSQLEAVRGLLYIELLNEGYDPLEAPQQAEEYFQSWYEYTKNYTVDTYLSSDHAALPIDAFLDVFMEINFDNLEHLTPTDEVISQKLLDKALAPDQADAFHQWIETNQTYYYSPEIVENIFQHYEINIHEIAI